VNEIGIPAIIAGVLLAVWVYQDAKKRRMDAFLWAFLVFLMGLIGLAIYLIVRRKHAPKESIAPLPAKSMVQATRTSFILSQIAATIVGILLVVFLSLFLFIIYEFIPCLRFMDYSVCLWPAVAFPMFFGYVFGPVVGFTTGFLGGIIVDNIIAGEIWLSLDIGLGLEGFLMGLATLILPERKRRENTGLLWCSLLAVVSSFASASFALLTDRLIGYGLPPDIYVSVGVDDAINGAIFTPIITFIYYRLKQAVAVAEVPGKPERGAPVSVPIVPQPSPRGIKPITSVSASMPLPTGYLASELARLNEEAKQYREYLTRLETFKAEGKVTEAVYEHLRREYMSKLEEIEQKMKQLTAK